jgi:hypothetical protein
MNEKFTPGEWRAEIEDHSFCDTGDYITTFGIVTGKNQFIAESFYTGKINEEEAAANCHLIAAAPEMYWMLEELKGDLNALSINPNVSPQVKASAWLDVKHIERVLKKARGEQ